MTENRGKPMFFLGVRMKFKFLWQMPFVCYKREVYLERMKLMKKERI